MVLKNAHIVIYAALFWNHFLSRCAKYGFLVNCEQETEVYQGLDSVTISDQTSKNQDIQIDFRLKFRSGLLYAHKTVVVKYTSLIFLFSFDNLL